MKKLQELLLLLALAAFGTTVVSCSDDDDPAQTEQNDPDNPDNPDDPDNPDNPDDPDDPDTPATPVPALGEVWGTSYYFGANDNGTTASLCIAVASKGLTIYEDEDSWETVYEGTGALIYFSVNIALPANPDTVTVPEGTYVLDAAGSQEAGTFNAADGDSYYTAAMEGYLLADMEEITGGEVEVTAAGDDTYRLRYDFTTASGLRVQSECTAVLRPVNYSEEGEFSNLRGDVSLNVLTQCGLIYYGDLYETGESEYYTIILGDENIDLDYMDGPGDCLMLTLNVAPGSADGIPAGSYDAWVDLTDDELESLPAGSCIMGYIEWIYYGGSWYFNTAEQYEARLTAGSVEVTRNGSAYTISGTVQDGYGHAVAFSYEGTPLFIDESEDSVGYAAKMQAGANSGRKFAKKAPVRGNPLLRR